MREKRGLFTKGCFCQKTSFLFLLGKRSRVARMRKEKIMYIGDHGYPSHTLVARSDVGWYKIYGVTDSAQKIVLDMKKKSEYSWIADQRDAHKKSIC